MDENHYGEAEASLEKYGIYASTTRGISMWPLFRTHRDTVYIAKRVEELKRFDVALYTDPTGKYILHRVLRVCDTHYIIRGDNTYRREYVPKNRVIGVLLEFDRGGKHHTVTERPYLFYVKFWNAIYFLRFPIAKAYYLLRKIYSKCTAGRNS